MDMNIVVIAALAVLAGGGVAFGIYKILTYDKNAGRKYQTQGKNVLVQDGVDVHSQTLGSEKGDYFTGNLERSDTNLVNERDRRIWRISFRNIDNGQLFQYRFCGRMWIGRTVEHPGEVSLALKNDPLVSKTHCVIYEVEGRLCLEDMRSKNHTYMNGIRADAPVYLENGCILKTGNTRLEVEYGR